MSTPVPDPLEDHEAPFVGDVLNVAGVPDVPPPELRFRRNHHLGRALGELWRSRGIVWSLTWRDLRSTYSQEVLGIAWALLAPLSQTIVFTFVFTRVGHIPHAGVPYAIFLNVGLLPWTFFSQAVSGGGTSLVGNALLNKVYAPREVFPISETLSAAVNASCGILVLIALFLLYQVAPKATSYWVPLLLVILVVFALGVTLLVSALTVYLRDMRHALPLMLSLGLFATPVVWPLSLVAKQWRGPYVALNPLAGVIDGIRRSVLLGHAPQPTYTAIAAASAGVWLLVAYLLFKRMEIGFADVS